ncbi:MAG: glucose-1-phosphate thymidylyltransferase [Flavobacteriaceae bacterium]|nr:glucose-1-phosphate thymidylyltransferase [Flavobacteriaceae bacterium]
MSNHETYERKGIILAGGNGSRLYPITKACSKQLLPIYDKPMIFYSLATLMLAGIRKILIITTLEDQKKFKELLGDGSQIGIELKYEYQEKPEGIAQAFVIAEEFINNSPVCLILGDNIFYGQGLKTLLRNINRSTESTIFAYRVSDPKRYGIVSFSENKEVLDIQEKPQYPKSNYAITGLYFYDSTVVDKSKKIKPSGRGEFEISDINLLYLKEKKLKVELFGRGMAWLDTGTIDSLHEASSFIKTLENRQGIKISCPEEIAWRNGWIDDEKLINSANKLIKSGYGNYLLSLLN